MSIDWFRDLVICILGVVATGILIFAAVLSYSLYHRTKTMLDLMITLSRTLQGISSFVDELAKPLIGVAAIIKGIRQGMDTAGKIFKKKKGGGDG